MTWKVRDEGSPRVRDGLSLEQVAEGLAEGEWGPTDEVRGPNDADWTPFENHPVFADAVAMEPLPTHEDEETHIDMTPIIDVAMVLLVFFILLFTYAVLEKRLEAATAGAGGPAIITKEKVQNEMIKVTATLQNGHTVYRIEDEANPTPADQLGTALSRFVSKTHHTTLLLEAADEVPHGDTVFVQDMAKGAGMERVMLAPLEK
jgi:biopolymer transport protein ExbD